MLVSRPTPDPQVHAHTLPPHNYTALEELQANRPAYAQGHEAWWGAVIARTALGAGAAPDKVEHALPELVPALLRRFSSKEGYVLYEDALPTCKSNFVIKK